MTEEVAALYSRVADTYAEQGPPRFAYAGRRLVEVARVGPGDSVLDVATGRGAVLLPAAECVGPTGRAVGIDIAAGMVERTRATIADQSLHWAAVQLMDAEQLQFADETFTHVLCSFAVFFFPNLPLALSEIWRVLRPGGIVGFAFQRGVDPRWAWYEELLCEQGALDNAPSFPGRPDIRDAGALVTELTSAGFIESTELVEDVELDYANAQSWWASLWTHGSRSALEALASEPLARLRGMCLERASILRGRDGRLPEQHRLVFVSARRPNAR